MSPPARIRYRRFERNFDMGEVRQVAQETQEQTRRDHQAARDSLPLGNLLLERSPDDTGLVATATALVSAPREVETYEGESNLEGIRRMLEQGKLSPDDLVDAGQGWQLIRECPLFLDEVESAEGASASQTWLWVGLTLVVLIVLAVALAA